MNRFEEILAQQIQYTREAANLTEEIFEFFWETKSPFSQWHKSNFVAQPLTALEGFEGQLQFSSAEQFMMLHKALTANDIESAHKIMNTQNVREQKAIGREVSNFDAGKWDAVKVRVVYEGNKCKFTQNPELMKALIATQGKTLVEAAPDDTIWGIGLAKDDVRSNQRATWLGTNYLGLVLTALRIEVTGEY